MYMKTLAAPVYGVYLSYVRVGSLLTCGKHLHDSIISLRREVWTHTTSLAPSPLIEVHEPRQAGKWTVIYLCVRISILPLSTILIFDFGIVPTVWSFVSFYWDDILELAKGLLGQQGNYGTKGS
jgi:hypothetical protein